MASSHTKDGDLPRRDFLYIAGASFGVFAAGAAVWPMIDSLNPAKDTLAAATTELDLSKVDTPGSAITVKYRGEPVFIWHRTAEQIEAAVKLDQNKAAFGDLRDPQTDKARTESAPGGEAKWLIVKGVCTHLGCIPKGPSSASPTPAGDYGGWYCPCHASHYDTSGRIRKGPAPANLGVPQYVISEEEKTIDGKTTKFKKLTLGATELKKNGKTS
jgi:ubiquinol-cytochrome c reductase iron-sulfur subunit